MIMCTHAHTTQHREGGAPVFAAISGKTHRDRRADCRADYYRSRDKVGKVKNVFDINEVNKGDEAGEFDEVDEVDS